jgi:Plasmid pRiA4b ORF-3-like protein
MAHAAAGKAELTGQVRSFLAWVGDGRKLTQTGRIGLVDARHLVESLSTGDTFDPQIGDRVFKTKSSEELGNLNRIVEWVKAARLVRVTGTRLVPVKKNAELADKPLDLVLALLAAYPRLGKAIFPRNTWRQSIVGDEFTDISQALLTVLLRHSESCPLAELSESAYDMIAARYVLARLTDAQHDSLRRTITVDTKIAMAALHVLGIVVLDLDQDTATLTDLGSYAIRRVRGMAQPGDPVLRVRITLADVTDPPVWRRVLIPAGYTLDRVHAVIQAAMGWQNSHLHQFMIGDHEYGRSTPDEGYEVSDETQFQLGDVVRAGDRIGYEYDFGDGWEHEVVIEAATEAEMGAVYPACVDGEGACPPEDCGGAPGFADLKTLLSGPPGPERDEIREWAGDYDPARFNLTAATAAVASI